MTIFFGLRKGCWFKLKCIIESCQNEKCYKNGLCRSHHLEAIQRKRTVGWEGKPHCSYPEYKVWDAMIGRCYYPNNSSYIRYGGKGVKVCDQWLYDFERFYKDMGPRPSSNHQIDRIDPDGNYCPDNCRWITAKENRRRSSQTKLSVDVVVLLRSQYRNSGKSMRAFAKEIGMNYLTVRSALLGINWSDVPNPIKRGHHDMRIRKDDGK